MMRAAAGGAGVDRVESLAEGGGSVLVLRCAAIGSVMTSLSFH